MKRFQVQAIQLKKTVMVYDFFFLTGVDTLFGK